MTCQDCQHMPSRRMGVEKIRYEVFYYDCGCKCHDAADAGPQLLELVKEYHKEAVPYAVPVNHHERRALHRHLLAEKVIAAAEGRS